MNREFHIFASRADTRFIVKGDGYPREFRSLFEAARHARSIAGNDGGLLVIHDEENSGVNRIPLLWAA